MTRRIALRSGLALSLVGLILLPAGSAAAARPHWTTTGSMVTARVGGTATRLVDGRVLVAGGYNDTYLASAAIYDPASGTWIKTGSMTTARYLQTATRLRDGRVLVAGGTDGVSLTSAEVFGAGRTATDQREHAFFPQWDGMLDETGLGGSRFGGIH